MWTVKNKSGANIIFNTVLNKGRKCKVPKNEYFDLDSIDGGRKEAERNKEVGLAFDKGFFVTVNKVIPKPKQRTNMGLSGIKDELLSGFKMMLQELMAEKREISSQIESVKSRAGLSEYEKKARLAILSSKISKIETNFNEIGRKIESRSSPEDLAELLSEL